VANIRRYTNTCAEHRELVVWLFATLETEAGEELGRRVAYMLLEELFLSFRLVEEKVSGPVSRRQSAEGFLQVVVLLEALDDLLQLLLPPLNRSKSVRAHEWHSGKNQQQKRHDSLKGGDTHYRSKVWSHLEMSLFFRALFLSIKRTLHES